MPRYEFICKACDQPFYRTLTSEEYEEGGTVCPECGSEDVELRATAFYPGQLETKRLNARVRMP